MFPYSLEPHLINGPRRKKTWLQWFANNKDADQPAHPRSLISAFVIRLFESVKKDLLRAKFQFQSGGGFESRSVGNPGDRFLTTRSK